MEQPKWTKHELSLTVTLITTNCVCLAFGCRERHGVMAFRHPNEPWAGFAYCPKHAEMLKEAQWRAGHAPSGDTSGTQD